jgi:hypothetical protein
MLTLSENSIKQSVYPAMTTVLCLPTYACRPCSVNSGGYGYVLAGATVSSVQCAEGSYNSAGSLAPCKECPYGGWFCQGGARHEPASLTVLAATAGVGVTAAEGLLLHCIGSTKTACAASS